MLFNIFQLLALIVFSFGVIFFISNKRLKRAVSFLFSIFFGLQSLSLYYGNSLIDYKFYKHFNYTDIKYSISFFWLQAILLVLFVGLVFILSQYVFNKFEDEIKQSVLLGLFILSTIPMSLSGGVFNNLYNIWHLNAVENLTLENALLNLDIQPKDYIFSDQVEASKGKNIIVISLESYEKGFLQDNFKHLTPHLRELKNKYQYFNMNQGDGSQWTAGSLYTYLTGVPMFLKGANNALQNAVDIKITGISSILDKAGYQQLYLMGNPDFGGSFDLIRANGIDVFPQSYYNEKYGEIALGLHDYDLFAEAKEQITKFCDLRKPFALYLSTISTHFPDGLYDERMESIVSKKESNIQFMVASVDHMIKDLLNFLEEKGELENTVFYIFPDHLLMGRGSGIINKFDTRELFLITNANSKKLEFISDTENIEQIDLAKIILDGAEIKHNAKFLTDYISGDKSEYIKNNVDKILALNEASLRIEAFNTDFNINLNSFSNTQSGNIFTLNSKQHQINFVTDTFSIKNKRYHAFVFDDYMKVKHLMSNDRNFIYRHFDNKRNVLIDIKDSVSMNTFIRKGNTIGKTQVYYKNDFKVLKKDIDNLKLIDDYSFNNLNELQSPYYNINNPEGTLFVTSSPNTFSESKPTYLAHNNKILKHREGLNIISLERPKRVEKFNVFNEEKDLKRFVSRVKKLISNNEKFVIISDTPKKITSRVYKNELAKLGLKQLSGIAEKRSYICYAEGNVFIEKMGRKAISIQVDLNSRSINKDNIKNNTERFIAHAGGKVKNKTYTNSLEALNTNYKKGFRYFELDIIKTSDNIFVAAHDWKGWKKKHNFPTDQPITLETFMATKVFNQFTPLSIKQINTWFKNHPDAILVTDKVNNPQQFTKVFNYKDRLIMELYSVKAIKEANNNNIKFLAAPSVFKGMNTKQKLEFIDTHKVKYMSISRKTIINNRAFYTTLKNKGVKLFAYHISFGPWSDESYVFINEFDYIYGMYADDWTFD